MTIILETNNVAYSPISAAGINVIASTVDNVLRKLGVKLATASIPCRLASGMPSGIANAHVSIG
jgi:hypothetical protein